MVSLFDVLSLGVGGAVLGAGLAAGSWRGVHGMEFVLVLVGCLVVATASIWGVRGIAKAAGKSGRVWASYLVEALALTILPAFVAVGVGALLPR